MSEDNESDYLYKDSYAIHAGHIDGAYHKQTEQVLIVIPAEAPEKHKNNNNIDGLQIVEVPI